MQTATLAGTLAFLLCLSHPMMTLLAATPQQPETGWLPIPPEELAIKESPAGPGAPALVLYREVRTDDVQSFESRYTRIKILSEEGREYGNVEIPYRPKVTWIEGIRARVVRPDGTSAGFNGQIYDRIVVKTRRFQFQAKVFSLPDVQVGSIIEYSYKVRWKKLPDVLQRLDSYIIQGVLSFGTATWDVQHELFTRRARFEIFPLPKVLLRWASQRLGQGTSPAPQPDGRVVLEVENVVGFQREEYMPPEAILKGRVFFFYVFGPAWSQELYWRSLGGQHAEFFEKFIGKSRKIERAVKELLGPNDSPEEKLRKIYSRVQTIRYLSYERMRSEKEQQRERLSENKSAEDVLAHGHADANEINLLFAAMVRAAGLEASIVEITARDDSLFRPQIWDPGQLDAMVISVKLGDQERFFDPATLFCPPQILPWEESIAQGIRIGPNGGTMVHTPLPESSSAVTERQASLKLLEDGTLQGKLIAAFFGQEALDRRLDSYSRDDSGRRKAIEDEVKAWLPAGASVEIHSIREWESSADPLQVECSVRIPHFAVSTGRRLLLPSSVFHSRREDPFRHAARQHPVYFRYPHQEKDDVTVELPADCRLEAIPPAFNDKREFGRVELTREAAGSTLRIRRHYVMDEFLFDVNLYNSLRAFFTATRTADDQKIVLEVR